jgi:hypothetical protein
MELLTQTQQLVQSLKADKDMAQPYKNFAVSDAIRLLALIEAGLRRTNAKPPADLLQPAAKLDANLQPIQAGCICPPAGRRADCPIHHT